VSDWLDTALQHAARDTFGNIGLAHLRRLDSDRWDTLVVGEDRKPLVFWASGQVMPAEKSIRNENGATLVGVVSTPPGVQPSGLIAVPVDANGSPQVTLVSVVSSEGITEVEAGPAKDKPPEPWGPSMLRSLLQAAAAQTNEGYQVARVDSSDGGNLPVLLDWDGRPLLFWIDTPEGERQLSVAAVLRQREGIIALAVDEILRPVLSEEALARQADRQGS
jgi:hypothetical protein